MSSFITWDDAMQHTHIKKAFDSLNKSTAKSLELLDSNTHPIEGRDEEIKMLYALLERPITPVAALLGQAGVGKTALVKELVRQVNNQELSSSLGVEYLVMSLRLGSLSSLPSNLLQATLSSLLFNIHAIEKLINAVYQTDNIRIILFIDEVHMLVTIFGPGTKIGGDVLKDVLTETPIRVIAATTRKEYDSTIAVDQPLAERFKAIEMQELDTQIVKRICKTWWSSVASDCPALSDEIIDRVLIANKMYRSSSAEPRKSLDILEDFVSYCRRTSLPITNDVVNDIFETRFEINLEFDVDPDEVYHAITDRVKGQPYAMYQWRRLLRSMTFDLDPSSGRPIFTALLTGPTGVGKTETCKALESALYPGKPVLLYLNMPDFNRSSDEARFRRRIGEFVRHVPSAIILMDEFEKAHVDTRDSMLSILDEGVVNFDVENREGRVEVHSISLRNTIVIATTNAGHEVFQNDAKFSSGMSDVDADELHNDEAARSEIETLEKALRSDLIANNFRPEMLNRFDRIIPYRALTNKTFITIAERQIESIKEQFKVLYDIEIVTNPPQQWGKHMHSAYATDLAAYITFIKAQAHDTSSGGARSIIREVKTHVYDTIVNALFENKGAKKLKVEVTKNSRLYEYGQSQSAGGVIAYAID